jgi:hypothetical protein
MVLKLFALRCIKVPCCLLVTFCKDPSMVGITLYQGPMMVASYVVQGPSMVVIALQKRHMMVASYVV